MRFMIFRYPGAPAASASRAGQRASGFTLIELLIVVAIIAILAAIAVPNFLEAQTRSKVARSWADMRSIKTAVEAYRVDNVGRAPRPQIPGGTWWGFIPSTITSPVAYMTSRPTMVFIDRNSIVQRWVNVTGLARSTAPYTYIYNTRAMDSVNFFSQTTYNNPHWNSSENVVLRSWLAVGSYHPIQQLDFAESLRNSGFAIYTSGPDTVDSTVWWGPATYDATNGTVSFGDVYSFGAGTNEGAPSTSIGFNASE